MNFGSIPEWAVAIFTCCGTVFAYGKITSRLETVIRDVGRHEDKFGDHDRQLRTHGEGLAEARTQIHELQRRRAQS